MPSTASTSSATPRWYRRVAVRLVLIVMLVLAVVSAAGFVATVVAFRIPGLFPADSSLRIVRLVATDAGRAWERGALSSELARIADETGLDVTVRAPDGSLVASTGAPLSLDEASRAASLRGVTVIRGFTLAVGAPVRIAGRVRGVVVVRFRNLGLTRVPLRGMLIAVGALILTAVLMRALSRSITGRIESLAEAARAFGGGDLSRRARVTGDDELGELGRVFDVMAAGIEARRREEREVLAGVSLELRSPVARLRVRLGLVEGADPRAIADVEAELDDIDRMVNDVLLAASLEQGVRALSLVWTQLRPLAARSRERLAVLSPSCEVRVEMADDLYVRVDPGLFAHVLDNLLDNAVQHGRGGGVIVLRGAQRGARVTIDVDDEGGGIPEAELARVVEPFARVEGSAGRGWGVGLALCRSLVVAHEGTLTLSRREGGGTRVRIEMPGAPQGEG